MPDTYLANARAQAGTGFKAINQIAHLTKNISESIEGLCLSTWIPVVGPVVPKQSLACRC